MPISIHALREEGDPRGHGDGAGHQEFLSTPSARRATTSSSGLLRVCVNFYPRPPRGGRLAYRLRAQMFLSISIHALREEGDEDAHGNYMTEQISIHALREEGDPVIPLKLCGLVEISIHALREEGDVVPLDAQPVYLLFLSTPSARRATLPLFRASENSDFYPRPPRGGRPCASGRFPSFFPISIHALREEGDLSPLRRSRKCFLFLSTPSARRATGVGGWADLKQEISIHALREEGDPSAPGRRR